MGAQQELVEGAVLEVLPEQAVEGEEGGEQGRDPERPGGDRGEGGRTRPRPEREDGRHHDEEGHRGRRFRRTPERGAHVPANHGGERPAPGVEGLSRRQDEAPAPGRR